MTTITNFTFRIILERWIQMLQAWPLEPVYPLVFVDAPAGRRCAEGHLSCRRRDLARLLQGRPLERLEVARTGVF